MSINDLPPLTEDEMEELVALRDSIGALGPIFRGEIEDMEPTVEALRMSVGLLRAGADALARIADRWEAVDA
jgi:hypothetical protein